MTARLRIFVYDIVSDRRRERVADFLLERAARVQKSVYEARLTDNIANKLFRQAKGMLAPGDQLRMYTVPDPALEHCREVGGPPVRDGARFWLV